MPFRPIQWAQRSVEGRQIEADGSRLVNFYAVRVPAPEESKVPVMLYSSPGRRRFLNVPASSVGMIQPPKGIHALLTVDAPAYGLNLFGLSARYQMFRFRAGTGHDIADGYDPFRAANPDAVIAAGNNRFNFTAEEAESVPADEPRRMVSDGRRVLWVSPNEVFMYDLGKTGGAGFVSVQAPDPADLSPLEDLTENEWVDCAWIDGYFILAARSGQFFHSLLNSEQFDQLEFAQASSNPDAIVGLAKLHRRLYVLGSESVENWYNTGGADFAFARDNSFVVEVGCEARATIATNETALFFLGHNLIVYMMIGPRYDRISTDAVEYDIARSQTKKARAYVYTEEGHRFYALTLVFADATRKTWAFDLDTLVWHERSATNILCATRFLGRNLIGLEGHSHIFDQRLDWGEAEADAGAAAIARTAISPAVFANLQRARMPSLHMDIPLRPGPAMPVAGEEVVTLDWSDDGGTTYRGATNADGTPKTRSLDQIRRRFRWSRLGQFRSGRNFRLRTSARRRVDILGTYVETEVDPD